MKYFPSKTFIVGEYAVLAGSPALLLAHAPYFSGGLGGGVSFHPKCAAGRLAVEMGKSSYSFTDPHKGLGGFGASGAEFLTVWSAHFQGTAWEAREKYLANGGKGSGSDIIVQADCASSEPTTANQLVELHLASNKIIRRVLPAGLHLRLFHTQRKIPTHEHLRELIPSVVDEASQIVRGAILHLESPKKFAASIAAYHQWMQNNGLVAEFTLEAVAALPKSVLAAKGCGAMGNDVLLVICDSAKTDLQDWIQKFSLLEILAL